MKILNIAVLFLVISLSAQAERLIYPEASVPFDAKSAESFQQLSDELQLGLVSSNFELVEVKQSLLGSHYYYAQVVNGHNVDGAEVVVSVNHKGEVLKVYNNAKSLVQKFLDAAIPFLSQEMVLELAWQHLKVNGVLMDTSSVKLTYSNGMKLIYKINLSTSSPFGHFELIVDAHTGDVISVTDAAIPRMKRQEQMTRTQGKAVFGSFAAALRSFEKENIYKLFSADISLVDGAAQVFDPNPVVTLGRTDLSDGTDSSEFLPAYRTQDLKEISYVNGEYSLKGPKVTLIDFETPDIAPSTSQDGTWMFERGNTAFNDAMTYLQIDRSVRYIESLGFVDNKAIFPNSIEVDANGVDGADNSHYIPSSKRLAFGHGCVDDNEDTDVILHELGHAIHFHINSRWGGGDTGAMGEGFGDYWAGSYSATTEGGMGETVNWVFKWDGHNDCWGGRKMNAFNPTYNPNRTYYAHSNVDGGISDEVWSTPIFQAFLELYQRGVARGDIDKIILEAHFGLGSGVKMPEMARAIVKTAKALFPNQDYDQVYTKHFKKQKIL